MAGKIKVLNIGALNAPHNNSWIYNDVVSFHNLCTQYDCIEVESYYFSYSVYLGNKKKILELISNIDNLNYDLVIYIIHGHGAYSNLQYNFSIDGLPPNKDNSDVITDEELLDLVSQDKFKSVLIVNTCNAKILPKTSEGTIEYIAPFIRKGQDYLNNLFKQILLTFDSVRYEFDDVQKEKSPLGYELSTNEVILLKSKPDFLLVFSFSSDSTTTRPDGYKTFAGSFADILAICASQLTVLEIMEIAKIFLTKSQMHYKPQFDLFLNSTNSLGLDIEINLYDILDGRMKINRLTENIIHNTATVIINT